MFSHAWPDLASRATDEMSWRLETPAELRQRAQRARRIARNPVDEQTARSLLEYAAELEAAAAALENRGAARTWR